MDHTNVRSSRGAQSPGRSRHRQLVTAGAGAEGLQRAGAVGGQQALAVSGEQSNAVGNATEGIPDEAAMRGEVLPIGNSVLEDIQGTFS